MRQHTSIIAVAMCCRERLDRNVFPGAELVTLVNMLFWNGCFGMCDPKMENDAGWSLCLPGA